MKRSGTILIVDDDAGLRRSMQLVLESEGMSVRTAASGEGALRALEKESFNVAFVDLRMDGMDGLELLGRIKRTAPATQVILLSAFATVENAVEAMRRGAHDVISKPIHRPEMVRAALRALDHHELQAENRRLRREVGETRAFSRIVGTSSQVRGTLDLIGQVAPTDAVVLIEGETGTGKELVARAIHRHSRRAGGPFVVVNCGALPESLLEAELFGHIKGAFTGADSQRTGRFEAADAGTLFLDEIGELSPGGQVKVLRAIETGTFERVGSSDPIRVDVRLVAATNRDLQAEVDAGAFRRDLYFRLNVVRIRIPPLRERAEDVPVLAQHFLEACMARHGKTGLSFSDDCVAALCAHDWPGNVRELENVVERAVILAHSEAIGAADLPGPLNAIAGAGSDVEVRTDGYFLPFGASIREVQREVIRQTVERLGGDKAAAARVLGVSTRTIYRGLQTPPASTPGNPAPDD